MVSHPGREQLGELLMLAQYRAGQPAEALDVAPDRPDRSAAVRPAWPESATHPGHVAAATPRSARSRYLPGAAAHPRRPCPTTRTRPESEPCASPTMTVSGPSREPRDRAPARSSSSQRNSVLALKDNVSGSRPASRELGTAGLVSCRRSTHRPRPPAAIDYRHDEKDSECVRPCATRAPPQSGGGNSNGGCPTEWLGNRHEQGYGPRRPLSSVMGSCVRARPSRAAL